MHIQQPDAERILLGGMLLGDTKTIYEVAAILRSQDFLHPFHRELASEIFQMASRHEPIDLPTVAQRLGARGVAYDSVYLIELLECCTSSVVAPHWARIVKDQARRRAIVQAALAMRDRALLLASPDEIISEARSELMAIASNDVREAMDLKASLMADADNQEKQWSEFRLVSGVSTGIRELDEMTCGFQPADFVVVGAQTSVGKTAFALQVSKHVAKEHGRVLWFSIEMTRRALQNRLIANESGIDSMRLQRGGLPGELLDRAVTAIGGLAQLPMVVDESPAQTVEKMLATGLRLREEGNLAMVVIDYLQLISGAKGRSRYEQITEISKNVKAMLRELGCPGLVLSQLRRLEGNEEPNRSHLRDSGQIEQDSDVILLLHVPDWTKPDDLTCIIGKQRNGPLGKVHLKYNRSTGRISGMNGKGFHP